MANITIDGKPYTVKDGITIIEAIDQVKIDLPRYCYHPGLSIAGNCRICQVEVEMGPRLPAGRQGTVIACDTRVAEGMVIRTKSQKAKESQQVVLEFLLANHPLDCPVCDQAGECKLQDYYMDYGLYDSKFNETKVKKSKKAFPIGPHVTPPPVLSAEGGLIPSESLKTGGGVMLDQERCILCSRCVRFADEVTKTHEFGIFNRGDHAEINVYPGKFLDNKYSGNVVDICPVGALTDKDFRFKMRVWYLGSQDSICPGCSRGCNIKIEYEKTRPTHLKKSRVMRLKPRENEKVNQWWICDEGRYAYKSIDENRITNIRVGAGSPRPMGAETAPLQTTWTETLLQIAARLKNLKSWALIASPQNTNEDLYLMKKIFRDTLKWKDIGYKAPNQEGYEDNFLIKKDKNPNSSGASQILGLSSEDIIPPLVSYDRKAIGSLSANETSGGITPIIEKAKRGELEGLFIFNHDLAKICGADTFKIIRQKAKTIIYDGTNNNPTAEAADFVLPSASYAEKDGTFTNFEGRVQCIRKAIEPLANSRPTWQILLELGVHLGMTCTSDKPESIFLDLARENAAFKGLDYRKIGTLGVVWNKEI